MSEYEHPYPAVTSWQEGQGWKTDGPVGEGLVWVVQVVEPDPREGTYDEYVVADRVENHNGRLAFSLRKPTDGYSPAPSHVVYVREYAPGVWRQYHLSSDPLVIAQQTAEMFKEDDYDA